MEQFPELASLSVEQKLTLADELTHLAITEQDANLRSVVRERWEDYQAHPESAVPWDQVKARILASREHAA